MACINVTDWCDLAKYLWSAVKLEGHRGKAKEEDGSGGMYEGREKRRRIRQMRRAKGRKKEDSGVVGHVVQPLAWH